jgi:hypothetical protein
LQLAVALHPPHAAVHICFSPLVRAVTPNLSIFPPTAATAAAAAATCSRRAAARVFGARSQTYLALVAGAGRDGSWPGQGRRLGWTGQHRRLGGAGVVLVFVDGDPEPSIFRLFEQLVDPCDQLRSHVVPFQVDLGKR